ncbi:MAG: hypothetical protein U5K54_03170 [Cytophagales bacterium]|nr:hypothetical protein [Cytophagales bacterium]
MYLPSLSQKKPETTKSFMITGEIKQEVKVTVDDLDKYNGALVKDVTITNHLGEVKSQVKKMTGVLLRDVLSTVEIKSENPRDLSACYLVCKATDGYTITYSWNEVFNNPAGESIYLITSKEGIKASDMEESVLMFSPRDYKTGRRYLKSLTSIEVKRAN